MARCEAGCGGAGCNAGGVRARCGASALAEHIAPGTSHPALSLALKPRSTSNAGAAAIEFLLVGQRRRLDLADVGLVVGGDDDDAALGDGVALAIFLGVVADSRAAGDEDVAVDDGAADTRMAADADTRHQDTLLDVQKLWTRTFGQRMLPAMRLPETMHPAEMIESSAWPQRRPSSAKTNFAGGAWI